MILGCVGLGTLASKNFALLAKWGWRFVTEIKALWRDVIASKYNFSDTEWWPTIKDSVLFKGPWVSIVKCCQDAERWYKTKVGKGNKTIFLEGCLAERRTALPNLSETV